MAPDPALVEIRERLALRELNRDFCHIAHAALSRALRTAYRRGIVDAGGTPASPTDEQA